MDDYTRKFDFSGEQDAEIHRIMLTVYRALEEKGYNPINQIVGYILSEDPTYITENPLCGVPGFFFISKILFLPEAGFPFPEELDSSDIAAGSY